MRRFAWWQVLVTLLVGPFGVGIVCNLVVSIAIGLALVDWPTGPLDADALVRSVTSTLLSPAVVFPSLVITALGFAGGPIVAARLVRADVGETLGLRRVPSLPVFLLAPIGILALGPASDVLVEFARRVAPSATVDSLGQIEDLVRAAPTLALLPFLALCPGFGEEILFRGFIQRAIGDGALAITVSAISFALIHFDPHHIVGVVPLGFYLAWVAARTGSTWVTITAHVANNAMAVLVAKQVGSATPAEHATWWQVLVGLGMCAACVVAIARLSPRRADDPTAASAAQ